jgi:hypothetical protein
MLPITKANGFILESKCAHIIGPPTQPPVRHTKHSNSLVHDETAKQLRETMMGLTGGRLVIGLALIAVLALLTAVDQIAHMELSQRQLTLPDWTLHRGQRPHRPEAVGHEHPTTPVGVSSQMDPH